MCASRGLTLIFAILAVSSIGEGVMGTMFVIWVKTVIHGGPLQLGWFMSAQAVGGIAGGIAIGFIGGKLPPYRLAWMGAIGVAVLDICIFNYPRAFSGVGLGLAIMVVVGGPASGVGSGVLTILQLLAPGEYRGRVFGSLNTIMALAQLIGTSIAGVFGAAVGPVVMLTVFQGGGYGLAGLVLLVASRQLVPNLFRGKDLAIAAGA